LARLLTPKDFGLIAMVTVITGFVSMFKDMGLSMATVQKDEINHNQTSTLFWINVMLSLGIMLITAALAPAIAWFYKEPRLLWITLALTSAFILGGLTVQHQALLRRQMRFGVLAIIEITSLFLGIAAAIVAGLYGATYWALVLMEITTAIVFTAGVWFACRWWPGLPVRRCGVWDMITFGTNLTGFNFLNYFARNLDNVLVGRVCGAGQLGLYSKAYNLLLLPIRQVTGPITAVAIPALSRLQNDPDKYRRYYYRAINTIGFITMPLVAMMAALSEEIIRVVLGEQWLEAGIIFKVLAFAAVFQPVVNTTGWVFISLGQTKRMMFWGLMSVPLFILSFVIGVIWGALGVAICYTICSVLILTIPNLYFAFRYSPISVKGFFKAIICPLTIGLITYSALELVSPYLASYNPIHIVLYSCITVILVFILMLIFWSRARNEVLNTLRIVKMLRSQTSIG
jgi:PST family polysaccharide transporter